MLHQVLDNHTQAGGTVDVSEPFPIVDGNALIVQVTSIVGVVSSVRLQLSDDLENWWTSSSISTPSTAPGAALPTTIADVGARFGRMRVETSVGVPVSLNIIVNTALL